MKSPSNRIANATDRLAPLTRPKKFSTIVPENPIGQGENAPQARSQTPRLRARAGEPPPQTDESILAFRARMFGRPGWPPTLAARAAFRNPSGTTYGGGGSSMLATPAACAAASWALPACRRPTARARPFSV